ncbi:ATP-binding protein [Streptococcus suis]|uniref:AAA family ATPase n=1 Tax=Streptococcus suis TaxID=1307 RepID=UPI0005CD9531|nr:AAA family ATPase [Streptococcus suis]MDY7283279.1 AAA family ATPase [Streptococcus suis]NQG77188.1 ATP-binding protein [Streptococcus suis]NQH59303.1 ATP-binding protein [Streptococcus suis]NQN47225.1 ATP-binding protein [Streptococcus suis]NQN55258.1 ATP-binding protein [Streptococcus suis]
MKLTIEKIGKINRADFEFEGLTVIAGRNSTGKSTVGKALFSMFNSFYKISNTYKSYRERAIRSRILDLDEVYEIFYFNENSINLEQLVAKLNSASNLGEVESIFKQYNLNERLSSQKYSKLVAEIEKIIQSTLEQVLYEETQNYFQSEFSNSINYIKSRGEQGAVSLTIKDDTIKTVFKNNKLVNISNHFSLSYKPIYIDDPFIIDKDNQYDYNFFRSATNIYRTHRQVLLSQLNKGTFNNPIDKIIVDGEIQLVYEKIEKILDENNLGIKYSYNMFGEDEDTLPIDSLSSGMKTFFLLKILLENGTIEQNSPVILDEPEVHLHPEWQLVLAEIIVLLQKQLNINFLINTHSPYFLRAIEVYTTKFNINSNTKYYLAENVGHTANFKDVTNDTSEIYKILAEPLQIIENERYN